MEAGSEPPGTSPRIEADVTNPGLQAYYCRVFADSLRACVLARRGPDLLHLSRRIYPMFSRVSADQSGPGRTSFAPRNLKLYKLSRLRGLDRACSKRTATVRSMSRRSSGGRWPASPSGWSELG